MRLLKARFHLILAETKFCSHFLQQELGSTFIVDSQTWLPYSCAWNTLIPQCPHDKAPTCECIQYSPSWSDSCKLQCPLHSLSSHTCRFPHKSSSLSPLTLVHDAPMLRTDHPLSCSSQSELIYLSSLCSREPFLTIQHPCKAMLRPFSVLAQPPMVAHHNPHYTYVIIYLYVSHPHEAVSCRRAKVVQE